MTTDDADLLAGEKHHRSDGFLKAASERWFEAGGVRYWVEDYEEDRDLKSE
jgi:hypothetical protein